MPRPRCRARPKRARGTRPGDTRDPTKPPLFAEAGPTYGSVPVCGGLRGELVGEGLFDRPGRVGLGSGVDGGGAGSVLVCPQEVLDAARFERALLPAGEGG